MALTVNGETTTVTTYAMSVDRLLQEQGVKVKTHDLVESTSPTSMLKNHDVVNVQSAYQTTITIDGQEVPFWTVASSAEQLLDFFNQNETEAAKITVNISNVYNKLTGGLIINQKGPVTVIADGKSSVAPNGKLPAASILDAKGITLGKEDRVSVEKDGKTTILRVRRVTHGEETRTKEVPFGTQTIIDPNLQPGEVTVRQEGENGEIQNSRALAVNQSAASDLNWKKSKVTVPAVLLPQPASPTVSTIAHAAVIARPAIRLKVPVLALESGFILSTPLYFPFSRQAGFITSLRCFLIVESACFHSQFPRARTVRK